MKQFPSFIIVLVLSFVNSSISLANSEANIVGNNYTINSSILEHSRKIQVYVPSSYKTKDTAKNKYPVLYLLDGQNWFLNTVSISKLLAQYGEIPELIIVGITTDDSPRYLFFQQKALLRDFLESEVIPFVVQRFPVNDEKMLFGWQYGGALTLDILAKTPSLFDHYMASSPYPIEGKNMTEFIHGLSLWPKDKSIEAVNLNFAANQSEGTVKAGTDILANFLKKQSLYQLTWNYLEQESLKSVSLGHRFSPLRTLFEGLINYYGDYPVLEPNSLQEFEELGGMNYVKSYYSTRATKFGFDPGIPTEGWFYLCRLALNEGAPEALSQFVKEMATGHELANINIGWNASFAKLLAKHQHYDDAISIYQLLIKRSPQEPMFYKRLADIYYSLSGLKNTSEKYSMSADVARNKAIKLYQRALTLATSQASANLEVHRVDLFKTQQIN
jgi:enterochelin esterase-like enzyme